MLCAHRVAVGVQQAAVQFLGPPVVVAVVGVAGGLDLYLCGTVSVRYGVARLNNWRIFRIIFIKQCEPMWWFFNN